MHAEGVFPTGLAVAIVCTNAGATPVRFRLVSRPGIRDPRRRFIRKLDEGANRLLADPGWPKGGPLPFPGTHPWRLHALQGDPRYPVGSLPGVTNIGALGALKGDDTPYAP